MMSVHDALEAWQQGEITSARAMALSGASDILGLYGLAESCGVSLRLELSESESQAADAVTKAIDRVVQAGAADAERPPAGTRAA